MGFVFLFVNFEHVFLCLVFDIFFFISEQVSEFSDAYLGMNLSNIYDEEKQLTVFSYMEFA